LFVCFFGFHCWFLSLVFFTNDAVSFFFSFCLCPFSPSLFLLGVFRGLGFRPVIQLGKDGGKIGEPGFNLLGGDVGIVGRGDLVGELLLGLLGEELLKLAAGDDLLAEEVVEDSGVALDVPVVVLEVEDEARRRVKSGEQVDLVLVELDVDLLELLENVLAPLQAVDACHVLGEETLQLKPAPELVLGVTGHDEELEIRVNLKGLLGDATPAEDPLAKVPLGGPTPVEDLLDGPPVKYKHPDLVKHGDFDKVVKVVGELGVREGPNELEVDEEVQQKRDVVLVGKVVADSPHLGPLRVILNEAVVELVVPHELVNGAGEVVRVNVANEVKEVLQGEVRETDLVHLEAEHVLVSLKNGLELGGARAGLAHNEEGVLNVNLPVGGKEDLVEIVEKGLKGEDEKEPREDDANGGDAAEWQSDREGEREENEQW